jgi:hypothetical protein
VDNLFCEPDAWNSLFALGLPSFVVWIEALTSLTPAVATITEKISPKCKADHYYIRDAEKKRRKH